MSATETVESYLIRTGVAHEQIDDTTWVVQLDDARRSRIAVKIEEPILLFSTPILEVPAQAGDLEKLYRTLLELNAELVHGAYALQGQRVVLSGTQQTESVDLNEFQATLDDMAMALDKHRDQLGSWTAAPATN
ncbi:MAG: YbjN domain-containing protein [Myxococcales bacterium FL481]|nr:MAG: YbjN domain-containing protein [Myxococcales bacterium FL481]